MIKVITEPTVEPVLLSDVKPQLGIKTDDLALDTILARRIKGARKWVEEYCSRALINQTLEFRFDTFSTEIKIPILDSVSITSIKYIDTNGDLQTLDSAYYALDTYDHVIVLNYGYTWPVPRSERNACRVQYVAGYGAAATSVPTNIIDCIINIVGHWTNYQAQIEHGGFITQVPGAIRKILDNYRTSWF